MGSDTDNKGDAMDATTHIVVGWNDDYDSPYTHEANVGESEGTGSVYEADVPTDLWDRCEQAWAEARRLEAEVVAAAGFDTENARMQVCCPQWIGTESPPRPAQWVAVLVSESEDEWPARDVTLGRQQSSPQEVEKWIAGLPESFHILPAYGSTPVLINRDRIVVVRVPGSTGYVHSCDRCGWDRDDHPTPVQGGQEEGEHSGE